MTKSTITRERLEQLADNNTICKVSWDERIELAQIALSAMDGEPVAWAWHYREQWHVTNDERRAEFVAKDGDVAVLPLYRHAQPAPVVPEEKPIPNTLSMYAVDAVAAIAEVKGWNACRAAMLAAATQLPGSDPATVPGKWIPVSEQMPEDRTQVILWDAEIGEVTSGHYSHKTHTFYHCGDAIENEITHWMPTPAAPQEMKGE
ncbi:DUF551 domain-containing protein [Klebsiella pneumoniae]|nr:DUF551 domain-containing protein [Klebsiella pneumoniae]MBA4440154.1 DUF551 domain-containing protein [Klebsiella pneumoniae]